MPLMKSWALQDAKNKFSAVAERAWRGEPQIVTKRGRPVVAIVSYALFEEKIEPKSQRKSLLEVLRSCPADEQLHEYLSNRKRTTSEHRRVALS